MGKTRLEVEGKSGEKSAPRSRVRREAVKYVNSIILLFNCFIISISKGLILLIKIGYIKPLLNLDSIV